MEDTINIDPCIDRFHEIDEEVQKSIEKLKSDFEMLGSFEPDSHSEGFAILIENLFCDIRILELDDELRMEDEISEKDLRDGMKEFLPKIQEY